MVEFVWTFKAIRDFGIESRIIGKRLGIVALDQTTRQPLPISAQPPGFFLGRFIRLPEILEAAVAASTGQDLSKHADQAHQEAARIIQEWIDGHPEEGIEGLQNAVYMAFILTADPYSISAMDAESEREKENKKLNQAQAEIDQELKKLKLENARENLETMKSGKPPATLPT